MDFFLGIDGGGTSCRAALALPSGEIVGRAKSGSANIRTDLAGSCENIVAAALLAIADAGRDPALVATIPAVLGLAGANVGDYARRLEALLPFPQSRVETDALIALEGAVGSGDGAIGILGTGTAFMARHGDRVTTVGGWGFLIGDQGSGSRIGRDLLEEALLAHDGVRPRSPLTDTLLDRFHNDPGEVVEFTTTARPGDFASFAPLVFEHGDKGDPTASMILGRVAEAVEASLCALDLRPSDPVCLLGGLAPLIAPRLSERCRAQLRKPLTDALGGAVAMAARSFGGRRA